MPPVTIYKLAGSPESPHYQIFDVGRGHDPDRDTDVMFRAAILTGRPVLASVLELSEKNLRRLEEAIANRSNPENT